MQFRWSAAFPWFLLLSTTLATSTNITVDDTVTDPTTGEHIIYTPNNTWHNDQNCRRCPEIDKSQVHDGTWTIGMSSTASPFNATLLFNGTAVYVYCILAPTTSFPHGKSNITFVLDGNNVRTYDQKALGNKNSEYNVTVYANDSLSPTQHTLSILPQSLILLDYIIYTHDNSSSTTSFPPPPASSSSTSASPITSSNVISSSKKSRDRILGGVFGAITALLLVGLGLLLYRRYKRRSTHLPFTNASITPPTAEKRNRWFQRCAATSVTPDTGHSFNPSLFVQRLTPNPAPITPVTPQHIATTSPYLGRSDTLEIRSDLATIPSASSQPNIGFGSASPPQRNVLLSIQEWQRRTVTENQDAQIPPFNMSEVDLSTHYDDSADSYRAPVHAAPQTRFTVMNN